MLLRLIALLALATLLSIQGSSASQPAAPILDVHLHAGPAANFGPPPVSICAPTEAFLPRDPQEPYGFDTFAACDSMLKSPLTDQELMRQTITVMDRYNIIGVASGPIDAVRAWKTAAPARIIPALGTDGQDSIDSIRSWATDGSIRVLGELFFQYAGVAPADSAAESYFELAEQLDLPVALHMGLGPPGTAYVGLPSYRMRLSDPLLLEDTLVRHPRLRLYVMHAGWPMLDSMIGLLYAHPQVYVDIGVIDWFVPRKEFHAYLRRLVDAGFGKRIMFGSDQMIWPEAIRIAIESVESAEFLSMAQKRDIFYNNASRFLRLSKEEIARHHRN